MKLLHLIVTTGFALIGGLSLHSETKVYDPLSGLEGDYAFAPELCNSEAQARVSIQPNRLIDYMGIMSWPSLHFDQVQILNIQHQQLGPTDFYFAYSSAEEGKFLVSVMFYIPREYANKDTIGIDTPDKMKVIAYSVYEFNAKPRVSEIMSEIATSQPADATALFRCQESTNSDEFHNDQ